MKHLFEALCLEPTSTEQCKGFTILNYRDISPDKSTRLSKIDESITPEPYILEVVFRQSMNEIKHRVYSFNNSHLAQNFQSALI